MAKVTIPWGDGSGDNFYIDYTGVEGSSESLITSDINQTGVERRKNFSIQNYNFKCSNCITSRGLFNRNPKDRQFSSSYV